MLFSEASHGRDPNFGPPISRGGPQKGKDKTMTDVTYWPTYEGLRVLQEMDEAELKQVRAECELFHAPHLLQRRADLSARVRARNAKLIKLARIARNVLTNQEPRTETGYDGIEYPHAE